MELHPSTYIEALPIHHPYAFLTHPEFHTGQTDRPYHPSPSKPLTSSYTTHYTVQGR